MKIINNVKTLLEYTVSKLNPKVEAVEVVVQQEQPGEEQKPISIPQTPSDVQVPTYWQNTGIAIEITNAMLEIDTTLAAIGANDFSAERVKTRYCDFCPLSFNTEEGYDEHKSNSHLNVR